MYALFVLIRRDVFTNYLNCLVLNFINVISYLNIITFQVYILGTIIKVDIDATTSLSPHV